MGSGPSIRHLVRHAFGALLLCVCALVAVDAGEARERRLTDPDLDAALVIDAASGGVLYARNAEAPRHPASLTKMMTLYLLFERLRGGTIALDTRLAISAYAASQPRSHLRLRDWETIPVDMAIKGIAIGSANDAAVVVAEALGGTEAHFAQMMTARARQLGMAHTVFRNATGLPDDAQLTTASDLAILARHLVYDFPQYYGYFGIAQMTWRGEDYTTHNSLIGNYEGADGIKTGYIDASGYNLVGTAARGGRRLIAVLLGGLTAEKRDEAVVALLDQTFEMPVPAPLPAIVRPGPPPPVASAPAGDARPLGAAILADPVTPLVWALAWIVTLVP